MIKYLAITTFVVLLGWSTESANPGFAIQVAQNGLNYAKSLAISIMNEQLPGKRIPDISGKKAPPPGVPLEKATANQLRDVDENEAKNLRDIFTYSLTNIIVDSFNFPDATSSLTTSWQGLNWEGSSISAGVNADYQIKVTFIKKSGTVTADTSGARFLLGADMGSTPDGHPQITNIKCTADMGDLKIHFHGGIIDSIMNLFSGIISDYVKGKLNTIVCEEATKILGKANAALLNMNVNYKFHLESQEFKLDYAFATAPQFTPQYFKLNMKGEISTDSAHYSEPAAKLPEVTATANMVYMQASDCVLNSLFYSMEASGLMHFNIDKKLLAPLGYDKYLNTTCEAICIGKLIPQLGAAYPNASANILLTTKGVAPTVAIDVAGAKMAIEGSMIFGVTFHDGSTAEAFVAHATLGAMLSELKVVDYKIVGKVSLTAASLSVTHSNIGEIDAESLEQIYELVVSVVIDSKLNELAENGIPIPAVPHVELINPGISLQQHCLLVNTDLKYTG